MATSGMELAKDDEQIRLLLLGVFHLTELVPDQVYIDGIYWWRSLHSELATSDKVKRYKSFLYHLSQPSLSKAYRNDATYTFLGEM